MVTQYTKLLFRASTALVFPVLCFASSVIADDSASDPLGIRPEEVRALDPATAKEAVWKMGTTEWIRTHGEEGRAVEAAMDLANRIHAKELDQWYHGKTPYDPVINEYKWTNTISEALNSTFQQYAAAKSAGTQANFDGAKSFVKNVTAVATLTGAGALPAQVANLILQTGLDATSALSHKSGSEYLTDQVNAYDKLHASSTTESIVETTYNNAQIDWKSTHPRHASHKAANESFRKGFVDLHLPMRTGMRTDATPLQNLAFRQDIVKNLRIAQSYDAGKKTWDFLRNSLGPDGTMTMKFDDLQKLQKAFHQETIGEIKNGREQIVEFLEQEKEERVESEKARKKDEDKKAESALIRQLKYDTAQSSVYILSTLTGFFDEKAGQAISVAGTAGIQIAQSIEKFGALNLNDAGQLLMSSVNLAAGIGQAANLIFKFALGAPDPMMLVMKEIQQLRKEVGELRKHMNARFDRVDRSINRLFAYMERGFQGLERRMNGLAYGLEEVREAMDSISRDLDRLNMSTYLYLRAGFQRPIEERLGQCVRSTGEMTLEKFTACLDDFRTFATRHTADALSTGAAAAVIGSGGENLLDPREFYASLLKELKKGLWGNLAVIAEAAERKFGVKGVRPLQRAPLVNVEDWAYYVNHYLEFIRQNSDYLRYMPDPIMGVTNSILDAGASVQLSLARLGEEMQVSSDDGNSQVAISVPELALKDYEEQQTDFKRTVVRIRERFEETRLRGHSLNLGTGGNSGYNPEGDLQTISPCNPNNILAHSDINEPHQIPVFTAPSRPELLQFVEKHIQAASHVGLGRLRVCYKDLWWKDSGENDMQFKAYEDGDTRVIIYFHRYAKAFLYVDVNFIFDDIRSGKSYVIAKKRISGKNKFRYKVHYYSDVGSGEDVRKYFPNLHSEYRPPYYVYPPLLKEHTPVKNPHHAWWFDLGVPNGGMNHRFDTAKAQWPGDLMGRFASESVDIADAESGGGITEMKTIWESFEARMRLSLMDEFKRELDQPSSLQVAADGLTGAKRFVQSLIELSYPVSIEKDDDLRSFFYGRESIVDSDTIRALWVSDRAGNGDARFSMDPEAPGTTVYSLNKQTIEKLKKKIKAMVHERGGKELHPLIQSRRSTLEIIQNVTQAVRPPTSLDAAWASLKSKLDDFRR